MHEFIEDHLIVAPGAETFQDIVYQRYREFCRDNNHRALSHTQFKTKIENLVHGAQEYRPYVNGERGPRRWKGFRLADLTSRVRSPFDDSIHIDPPIDEAEIWSNGHEPVDCGYESLD